MKKTRLLLIFAGLLTGTGLAGSAWSAPAIQDSAVTYTFQGGNCGYNEVVDSGIRGNQTYLKLHNVGFEVSEDPRLTGWGTVDVEVYINNVNGHVTAHGSWVLEPLSYAGTWVADFNIQAPGGKSIDVDGIMIARDSKINAKGTGVFEGQWFFSEHGLTESDPPYDLPVEAPEGWGCEFGQEIFTGRILNPNAK